MKRPLIKTLIMDDRPMIRAGIRAMLKASDIRVVGEAGTADEALRLVGTRRPNLLLLSGRMHEAEGTDFLRRLKEKWSKVPVIIVTTNESPLYLSRALKLACSGYLLKTLGREELVKAVRAVARGEYVVQPPLLRKLLEDIAREQLEAGPKTALTVSEREVLRLITEGQTNLQIAQRLGYRLGTVKDCVQKVIQKLEVSDRTQAAVKALRLGLLD